MTQKTVSPITTLHAIHHILHNPIYQKAPRKQLHDIHTLLHNTLTNHYPQRTHRETTP